MATAVDVSTLNGYFKDQFGEKQDLVPEYAIVTEKVKFRSAERLGEEYRFPVKVQRGHGITFNGGATVGTAFDINAAKSGLFQSAHLAGTEFIHRDVLAYGAASRARSDGPAAFGDAVDELYLDMQDTTAFYRELTLLYGGDSIGTIDAEISGAGTLTQVKSITTASWAPAIWSQMQGAYVDVYDPTLTTKRNSGTVEVTAINADAGTRQLTLVGVSPTTTAEMDAMSAADVIVPRGAKGNWFDGIKKILSNTGSLFGISAATYTLWAGNQYPSIGGLTMGKIQQMVTTAVARGLMEEFDILISPFAWTDLNNDHAALRRFGESTKGGLDLGTKKIEYYGSNGSVIRLHPHPMVKAGDAFGLPFNKLRRVGSTDTTFDLDGSGLADMPAFFKPLADKAGFELRCYWDQAIIMTQPAKGVYGSGITTVTLG